MPEAGAQEHRATGRAAQPLPLAARRKLWQSVWDRLLAPPSERQGGGTDRPNGNHEGHQLPEAGRRQDGEAA